MNIEEELKKIVIEIDEGADVESMTRESRLREDLELTSIALLYMAVAIEERFGVDLAKLDPRKLETAGDVIDVMEAEMKANEEK